MRRLNVGPVAEDGGTRVYRYPFTNTGDRPLEIKMVRTTCSCVAAKCNLKVIQPGGKAEITAVYDPKGHPGSFERRIFVYTQEGNDPAAVLKLDVTVTAADEDADRYPVRMGVVRLRRDKVRFEKDRKETAKIRVLNTGGKSVKLGCEEAFLPDCISFEARPAELEPGQEGEIVIFYDPVKGDCRNEVILMLKGLGVPPRQSAIKINIE